MKSITVFAAAAITLASASAFAHGQPVVTESYGTNPNLEVRTFPPARFLPFYRGNLIVAWLENTSHDDVVGPTRIVVRGSNKRVKNADAVTPSGDSVYSIDDRLDARLTPGEQSHPVFIVLKNRRFFWALNKPFRGAVTAENAFTLQVLHTADNDGNTGLESVQEFSGIIEELADAFPGNTVRLASGDLTIPGPSARAQADAALETLLGVPGISRGDYEFHNLMGFQASTIGNHDLDGGVGGFRALVESETGSAGTYNGALFPFLTTNIDYPADPDLAALQVADGQLVDNIPNSVARYAVVEVAGETIGLVGAVTPTLGNITNIDESLVLPGVEDIDLLAAEIQPSVDALVAMGVDKIIMLGHMQQLVVEEGLAQRLTDVDIIVGGGSNAILADTNDRLRTGDTAAGTYPELFVSPTGEPVAVVNVDGDFRYVGRLVSAFDADGLLIPELLDDSLSGAFAADTQGLTDSGGTPNPGVVDLVDAINDVLIRLEGNIFGSSSVYLEGRRFVTINGLPTGVRYTETNLGNLSADANLAYAQGFDSSVVVSLKNGGGIRSDIGRIEFPPGSTDPDDQLLLPNPPIAAAGKAEGDISQADIARVLAFNNGLVLLSLTASELVQSLENGVSRAEPASLVNAGNVSGRFPQVAGVTFSFDPQLPAGARIQSMVVETAAGPDTVVQNGAIQGDVNRTFRLVTLNFLADGGDGYPFDTLSNPNRVDLVSTPEIFDGAATFAATGSEQDALAEFLLAATSTMMPFSEANTLVDQDTRIQNLDFRTDTVIPTP